MQPSHQIPKDKFVFVQADAQLHDEKFEVKPISYLLDAWLRFRRNKASLVATGIIVLIVLYAVIAPFTAHYKISDADGVYAKMRPKNEQLSKLGIATGQYDKTLNDKYYLFLNGIGVGVEDNRGQGATWQQGADSPMNPLRSLGPVYNAGGRPYRNAKVDSYFEVGFKYINITRDEFARIQAWEAENGLQVLYPMVDLGSRWAQKNNEQDANFWFRHNARNDAVDENGKAMNLDTLMEKGFVDNYLRDAEGNVAYFIPKDRSMIQARALYYNYFIYRNGYEPLHVLGTDGQGFDILVRMAYGIRLSLILAISVSLINLSIGALYGAVEGYYGGTVDLIMERISDVLDGIPFIVVATLFQLHLVNTGKVSVLVGLLLAFVLTGWLGTAYLVRTQFYRFKGQEYVLSARTLGARNRRLMFKHIFPNTLGTIITSSVLVIPGVIFTESSLSYLGIANFNASGMTSLGTMLANGQRYLKSDPHIIFFPAIVISLLMISFNLFGNGLRDAFNPSLRGAED